MIERENIFVHLQTIMKEVPGVKLATRADLRAVIDRLQEAPAIVITDLGSNVEGRQEASRNLDWLMSVGITSIVKGTTEALAASELAAFETEVERVLHKRIWDCNDVGDLITQSISPIIFPKAGSKIAVQGMGYKIRHYEDIQALIT